MNTNRRMNDTLNYRMSSILTYPTCIRRHIEDESIAISPKSLASDIIVPGLQRCLRDPVFSRFGRTPTCDRRTDRLARPQHIPR